MKGFDYNRRACFVMVMLDMGFTQTCWSMLILRVKLHIQQVVFSCMPKYARWLSVCDVSNSFEQLSDILVCLFIGCDYGVLLFQYWQAWIWAAALLAKFGGGHQQLGDESESDNVLHIGGIFPINGEGGWQGGQACMPAAHLALEDVNKRKDLLSGYVLKLHSNDSEVSDWTSPLLARLRSSDTRFIRFTVNMNSLF